MAENKFKRYLWLIQTIRSFGPISFYDINLKWEHSILNPNGEELPKKTFHNHCEMISETFGIDIICKRKGGYKYCLDESIQNDKWLSSFLDMLTMQASMEECPMLRDRILVRENDRPPLLPVMMDFIKNKTIISFTFNVPESADCDTKSEETEKINLPYPFFGPLGLVHLGFTWFVIGAFAIPGGTHNPIRISAFSLAHMKNIVIMEDAVFDNYPENFSIQEYINNFSFDLKKDNDFIDERVWLALHLGKLIDPNKTAI